MSCSLSIEKKSDKTILYLEGDFIIYHITEIKEKIYNEFKISKVLVLDLKNVTDFDTTAVQLILALKREANLKNRIIHLCNHSESVLKILDIYGLIGMLEDKIKITPEQRKKFNFSYGLKKNPNFLKL